MESQAVPKKCPERLGPIWMFWPRRTLSEAFPQPSALAFQPVPTRGGVLGLGTKRKAPVLGGKKSEAGGTRVVTGLCFHIPKWHHLGYHVLSHSHMWFVVFATPLSIYPPLHTWT